jgi:hypothetical protein
MICPLETSACGAHGPCDKPGRAQEGYKADVMNASLVFFPLLPINKRPVPWVGFQAQGLRRRARTPQGLPRRPCVHPPSSASTIGVAAQACLPSWTAAHMRHTRRHRRRGRRMLSLRSRLRRTSRASDVAHTARRWACHCPGRQPTSPSEPSRFGCHSCRAPGSAADAMIATAGRKPGTASLCMLTTCTAAPSVFFFAQARCWLHRRL